MADEGVTEVMSTVDEDMVEVASTADEALAQSAAKGVSMADTQIYIRLNVLGNGQATATIMTSLYPPPFNGHGYKPMVTAAFTDSYGHVQVCVPLNVHRHGYGHIHGHAAGVSTAMSMATVAPASAAIYHGHGHNHTLG